MSRRSWHRQRRAARRASGNGKSFVSPVVARIASEHGIDPSQVPGTGNGGRVTKRDIQAFIDSGAQRTSRAARTAARRPSTGARTYPAGRAPTGAH